MRTRFVMVAVGCVAMLVMTGCSRTEPVNEAAIEADAATEVDVVEMTVGNDVVYVCNCGPECDCGSISKAAGSCSCGSELVATHVVKIDGHDALLCTCGDGCDCEIDSEDETKCACGADLRKISLEGSGLYFCNCGGSCTCNYVSTEPGTCTCGAELITS